MLEIQIRKRLGDFALDVEIEVPAHGVLGVVGASGAGKSTLFACIAGLTRPDAGRIRVGDLTLFDSARRIDLPTAKRGVGVVFQEGLLFPHMTVRRNLLYGAPRFDRPAFARLIDVLAIGGLLERRPGLLSGGERQRVAIGRALLREPRLLLLDEPLAALDPDRKDEVMGHLEAIRDAMATPILYISHAPGEIRRLADRVVVLRHGKIVSPATAPAVWGPQLAWDDPLPHGEPRRLARAL